MNSNKKNVKFAAFYVFACIAIVVYACTKGASPISSELLSSQSSMKVNSPFGSSVWKFQLDGLDCISPTDQYYYAAPYSCPGNNANQRAVDSSLMSLEYWADNVWGSTKPKPAPPAAPCPTCLPPYINIQFFGTPMTTSLDNVIGAISGTTNITMTIYVLQNGTTGGATYIGLTDLNGNSRCFGLFPTSSPVYENNASNPGKFYSTGGLRYDVSMTVNLTQVARVSGIIKYLTNGLPSAGPYAYTYNYTGTSYAIGALAAAGITFYPSGNPPHPYDFGNYLKIIGPPASNVTISVQPGISPQDAGDFSGIQ
jgi:hypothetical protein